MKYVVYKLNTDPGNTQQTVGDIQKEYKKLNKEIQDTVQGSEEYYAIVARMGDLKSNIKDLREEVNALDPGEKLAALGKLAQGAVGAYTTLTSAVSVFAGSNEELQQQLLKVNAAIGLLQGMQSVLSTLDEGSRILKALTVSAKANAAAVKEAEQALKLHGLVSQSNADAAQKNAEAGKEIAKAFKNQTAAAKGWSIAVDSAGTATQKTANSTKVAAAAMKDTAAATKQATAATKGFGTAFKAIGIGLIVSAIAYLIANWEKLRDKVSEFLPFLKDTGEAFNKVKEIAYGVGNALIQFVAAPINGIIKLISGDFKGAIEAFKKGVDFVGNYEQGAADERQAQRDEANRKALEASIKAVDNEVAVMQAGGKKTYAIEKENLRRRLELYKDNFEEYNKVLQDIRLLDARHEKEQADEREKARKQQEEDLKKRNEEIRKAEEERLRILIDANAKVTTLQQRQQMDALNEIIRTGQQQTQVESELYNERFGQYNEFAPKMLEATQATANVTVEQQRQASAEINKIKQDELEQEIQLQLMRTDSILALTGDMVSNIATLLGESAEDSKAVQIVLGTIDSIRGAISAYMGMVSTFPGPWGIAAGAVAAGVTFATGMANVTKMKSVNTKSKSTSTPSLSYSAPAIPTTANVTQLDQTSVDQITQRNAQPQRAYVVEADITSTQERVNNYSEAAQF